MKALSLKQPWATLVATEAKKIETRSWQTSYRGPLAIHASKTWNRGSGDTCILWPFHHALRRAGVKIVYREKPRDLPFGAVIAICQLIDVQPITTELIAQLSVWEYAVGHYEVGRYAWYLDEVKPLDRPIAATGRQGLWDWEYQAE